MNKHCKLEELKRFMSKQCFVASDPKWPQVDFDPINGIEGLKLMHMYESHGHAM